MIYTPSVPEILLTLRLSESRMNLPILLSISKEKPDASVHSHPGIPNTKEDEVSSMGYT